MPELAVGLNNVGYLQELRRRFDDSRTAYTEAREWYRTLHERHGSAGSDLDGSADPAGLADLDAAIARLAAAR